jgi:hypothetical protein
VHGIGRYIILHAVMLRRLPGNFSECCRAKEAGRCYSPYTVALIEKACIFSRKLSCIKLGSVSRGH